LALFHDFLNLLPDPLLSWWLSILGRNYIFLEEGIDELGDELWFEKLVKLLLVVGARQS